jgi:ligand-binding sensor domain-containing protein
MRLSTILILVAGSVFVSHVDAQWINYDTNNSGIAGDAVFALATQSDGRIWIGDGFSGVSEFDNGNWMVYDMNNSGMPINGTLKLEIAPNGDKWIATNTAGIAVFDDNNWTVYTQANTGMPIDMLQGEIGFNGNGDVWIAPYGGLIHFDGNTWTLYNITNSSIQEGWNKYFATEDFETFWSTRTGWGQTPYLFSFNVTTGDTASYIIPGGYNWTEVFDLDFDRQGNLWIITLDGLFKFDGVDWTQFHTSNSSIPANDLRVLLVDSQDDLWLGTFGAGTIYGDGLIKFDGNVFTQWTMANSGLPNYSFTALEEDIYGNLWIGHNGGGATIFEDVIGLVNDPETNLVSEFHLYVNYPNPFNPATIISFSLPVRSNVRLTAYNLQGQVVALLVNGWRDAGIQEVTFNALGLVSGIYLYRLQTDDFVGIGKMVLMK